MLIVLTMLLGLFGYTGLQSIQKMAKVTDEITQAESNLIYARLCTRSYLMLRTDKWAEEAKAALAKIVVNTDNLVSIIDDKDKSQEFLKLKSSAEQYRSGLDDLITIVNTYVQQQSKTKAIQENVIALADTNKSAANDASITLFLAARVLEGEYISFLRPEDKDALFSAIEKAIGAAQATQSPVAPLLSEYKMEAQKLVEAAAMQKEAENKQIASGAAAKQIIGDQSAAVKAETQQKAYTTAIAIMVIFILSLIFGIMVAGMIVRQIMNAIRQSVSVAEQVAAGDLTIKIDDALLNRDDEMGKLIKALNTMVIKLRETVESIAMGAANISAAGAEMSGTSQSMSEGSTEQASAAEEVSSSMEQMAANIQQNTDNAQQAEKIAIMGVESLRKSNQTVNEAIAGMKTIAEKVTIISDIAFQTNILALNAAVEAARAGEHGRGFAVVAAEVRKLAERSKVAADEINVLSRNGVTTSDEAGKLLSELMPQIEKTAKLVQEISAASIEQNSGASQINNAIQQLNQVTQQNAAASEEMATSSEELASQAETLKDTVAFFKLEAGAQHKTVAYSEAKPSIRKQYAPKPQPTFVQKQAPVRPKQQPKATPGSKGIDIKLGKNDDSEYEHF